MGIEERNNKNLPTRHFHPASEKRVSIQILKAVDKLFARVYHNVEVRNPLNLPKTGPAIVICNHTSGLDPMLLQSCCHRLIIWMVAKEYYELKFLKPFFKTLEAIPVDRAARDTGAVRLALRALSEGRVLGVFPEGKISPTRGTLLPFQPGVAQMAIKMRSPIYPAYLDGTQCGITDITPAYLRRQRAILRFGEPIDLFSANTQSAATKPSGQELSDQLQATVAALSRK